MLQIRGIEKSYKDFHLGPVNLELPEGYIMGLVGENGAGKSTLIHILMNLVPALKGEVRLFGKSYLDSEVFIKNQIGFVYEENCFYPNLTPAAIIRLLREAYKDWDQSACERLMKHFGIEQKPLAKLSKGQRGAFHFLTALCHNARLLILDEPTAGLDPIVRREILEELRRYVEPGGRSVLISTHITSDLEQTADLITFLHEGKILFTKDVEELRETFHVVKGEKTVMDRLPLLGRQERRTHTLGLFEGSAEELPGTGVEAQPATLEDIMYFMKRGDGDATLS